MNSRLLLSLLLLQLTFILLNISSLGLLESYGINEIQEKNNTINFEKLVSEYINWWSNVPIVRRSSTS